MVPSNKKMEANEKGDESQQVASPSNVGLRGTVEEQYRKIKENAETYPYVWGSYIVGGFSLWMAYRWRKLQMTEDRVRVLEDRVRVLSERLRQLVQADESTKSAAVTVKPPPSTDKTTK